MNTTPSHTEKPPIKDTLSPHSEDPSQDIFQRVQKDLLKTTLSSPEQLLEEQVVSHIFTPNDLTNSQLLSSPDEVVSHLLNTCEAISQIPSGKHQKIFSRIRSEVYPRFVAQANAIKKLNQSYIPEILQYDEECSDPLVFSQKFLAMEEGQNLLSGSPEYTHQVERALTQYLCQKTHTFWKGTYQMEQNKLLDIEEKLTIECLLESNPDEFTEVAFNKIFPKQVDEILSTYEEFDSHRNKKLENTIQIKREELLEQFLAQQQEKKDIEKTPEIQKDEHEHVDLEEHQETLAESITTNEEAEQSSDNFENASEDIPDDTAEEGSEQLSSDETYNIKLPGKEDEDIIDQADEANNPWVLLRHATPKKRLQFIEHSPFIKHLKVHDPELLQWITTHLSREYWTAEHSWENFETKNDFLKDLHHYAFDEREYSNFQKQRTLDHIEQIQVKNPISQNHENDFPIEEDISPTFLHEQHSEPDNPLPPSDEKAKQKEEISAVLENPVEVGAQHNDQPLNKVNTPVQIDDHMEFSEIHREDSFVEHVTQDTVSIPEQTDQSELASTEINNSEAPITVDTEGHHDEIFEPVSMDATQEELSEDVEESLPYTSLDDSSEEFSPRIESDLDEVRTPTEPEKTDLSEDFHIQHTTVKDSALPHDTQLIEDLGIVETLTSEEKHIDPQNSNNVDIFKIENSLKVFEQLSMTQNELPPIPEQTVLDIVEGMLDDFESPETTDTTFLASESLNSEMELTELEKENITCISTLATLFGRDVKVELEENVLYTPETLKKIETLITRFTEKEGRTLGTPPSLWSEEQLIFMLYVLHLMHTSNKLPLEVLLSLCVRLVKILKPGVQFSRTDYYSHSLNKSVVHHWRKLFSAFQKYCENQQRSWMGNEIPLHIFIPQSTALLVIGFQQNPHCFEHELCLVTGS